MADLGDALLSIWIALSRAAGPLGQLIVRLRLRHGKEDPARWRERLGNSSALRPDGPLCWVHAVSVGEAMAAMPVVDRLIASGVNVLITTVTTTSAALVAHRVRPGLIHQYAPLDLAGPVDRFLDHWRPDLALLVESEVWPVMIGRLAVGKVPLVVANGHMSPRSFSRWTKAGSAARAVFGRMARVLAQTDDDADRFRRLGARSVITAGNIKFDAGLPETSVADSDALAAGIGDRPLLLAASTHAGEEEIVLAAFAALRRHRPDVLLAIVPRHPVRGADVERLAQAAGFATRRRSLGEALDSSTDVYVADTLGELAAFFRLSKLVLMGGTLIPDIGGHNLIEPARLGAAVLSGPHFANWIDIYGAFVDAGGLTIARGAEELADAALALIGDDGRRAAQIEAANRVVAGSVGAVGRTVDALLPLIGKTGAPC